MSTESQKLAFEKTIPENSRFVIVATNVAETSLTLPNVRYVVDCGREKKKEIAASGGVSRFKISFASQAAVDQRAGRAGRVGPGHCYRLFTPAVYGNFMAPFPAPEVSCTPLDQPLLFLASLGVHGFLNFPWPTPPTREAVLAAAKRLAALGACDEQGRITEFGKKLAVLPISPRYAVTVLRALQRSNGSMAIVAQACACVAGLTVGEVIDETSYFIEESERKVDTPRKLAPGWTQCSTDIDAIVWAIAAFMWTPTMARSDFVISQKLNAKSVEEAASLTRQLYQTVVRRIGKSYSPGDEKPSPPTPEQRRILHESVVEGLIDRLAAQQENSREYKTCEGVIARIHPGSRTVRADLVAYSEISVSDTTGKAVMRCVLPVDPGHLARLESPLIDRGATLKFPPPKEMDDGTKVGFFKPMYKPLDYNLPTVDKRI